MPSLFLKEEDVEASPPIVGYRIMQILEKKENEQVSIFEVTDKFKNEHWFSPRELYMGMIFLYSVGLVDFKQPYIVKNV